MYLKYKVNITCNFKEELRKSENARFIQSMPIKQQFVIICYLY